MSGETDGRDNEFISNVFMRSCVFKFKWLIVIVYVSVGVGVGVGGVAAQVSA